MFSNREIANTINSEFEPVWESVRDVPRFTLDFGKGQVVQRTLYGNVATYVCTADGVVLDVMPGLYSPQKFLHNLSQFRMLAQYVQPDGRFNPERLAAYHDQLALAVQHHLQPGTLVRSGANLYLTKAKGKLAKSPDSSTLILENPNIQSPAEVAQWKALIAETTYNEITRRSAIHRHLAKTSPTKGDGITKWIYKEVLHADLDDPYIGLGPTLFATYPFAH